MCCLYGMFCLATFGHIGKIVSQATSKGSGAASSFHTGQGNNADGEGNKGEGSNDASGGQRESDGAGTSSGTSMTIKDSNNESLDPTETLPLNPTEPSLIDSSTDELDIAAV